MNEPVTSANKIVTANNTNLAYLQLHQVFPLHHHIHDLPGDLVVQVPPWSLVYLSCLAYPKKKKGKSSVVPNVIKNSHFCLICSETMAKLKSSSLISSQSYEVFLGIALSPFFRMTP